MGKYITQEISIVCYSAIGSKKRVKPCLSTNIIVNPRGTVQANNEDALRPDPIAVSISTSHLRGDVRKDARKRELIARGIPTSEFLPEIVRFVLQGR